MKNILNYRKPTFWVVCVAVAVIASMCLLLTSPQRITLPDGEAVQTVEMEQFNEGSSLGFVTITDKVDILNVLSNLSGAKKTIRHSTNDYPDTRQLPHCQTSARTRAKNAVSVFGRRQLLY
ncbi:MAG: hypothetical protein CVU87_12050 [Firmicutes bacterium HGW-Firmicutes-12]|nr:MAG: hypothetical protein CVU87_12050 [Firmicutes bacterium HGW-Firmicutes-12]